MPIDNNATCKTQDLQIGLNHALIVQNRIQKKRRKKYSLLGA